MACTQKDFNNFQGTSKEKVMFFDKQNGGLSSAITYNNEYVWQDGSHRALCAGEYQYVLMYDATWVKDCKDPRIIREYLWYRARYVQQKLQDSIVEFEAAKNELERRANLSAQYGANLPPDKLELKQVKRLRHVCRQWEKKLVELDALLNPQSEEYVPSDEERKIMNENSHQAISILDELKSLEV